MCGGDVARYLGEESEVNAIIRLLLIAVLVSTSASRAEQPAVPGVERKIVELGGIDIHYAVTGNGPLIVFLHGFPEFWYQWKGQLVEFGRDHMAVAPDLRGYNLSSSPVEVERYRAQDIANDVRMLADHLGKSKFVLVGHDWGGIIAWTFAAMFPERLEKLVIINAPHPIIFERELRENPAQQAASKYMALFNTPDAEKVLAKDNFNRLVTGVLGDGIQKGYVTEAEKAEYLKVWGDGHSITGGLNYYRAGRVAPPSKSGEEWSVFKHYSPGVSSYEIRVPTLVVWGLQDPFLLGGNLSGLGRYVPDVRFKFFPDTGHWVNRAKSTEVNAAIRQFLTGQPIE